MDISPGNFQVEESRSLLAGQDEIASICLGLPEKGGFRIKNVFHVNRRPCSRINRGGERKGLGKGGMAAAGEYGLKAVTHRPSLSTPGEALAPKKVRSAQEINWSRLGGLPRGARGKVGTTLDQAIS
jgi:hypothetical protein